MLVPTITMGTLAIILVLVGYYQGQGQHISGLRLSIHESIWTWIPLPLEGEEKFSLPKAS